MKELIYDDDGFVESVNPCMSLISAFRACVTILCCATRVFPSKRGDSNLISNIAPHPPDVSLTNILVGLN